MSGIDPKSMDAAGLTSIGQVRTSNQDYFDVFERANGSRLFVVADGMGGHRGGATASRVATETMGEMFQAAGGDAADTLFDAIHQANQRVHQISADDPELRGMGTTVVCMLFGEDGRVWVAHVGDSRAYRLHADGIEQITQDHSVVGEMVRRGLITPEEAEAHPRRNEILRSVGIDAEVEVDVAQVVAAPGDHYLLCSDGLTGLVADDEIHEVVRESTPREAAERLVGMANARGGHDNVTVQIIAVPEAGADRSAQDVEAAAGSDTGRVLRRGLIAAAILLVTGLGLWFALAPGDDATTPPPVTGTPPPPVSELDP